MVFIRLHNTWHPAQIMDKKASKYLVEIYRENGDNSTSERRHQYWRTAKDMKLFTYDTWSAHGNYAVMRDAFEAYRAAGGYVPARRMRPSFIL
jgi:hypothetical protein